MLKIGSGGQSQEDMKSQGARMRIEASISGGYRMKDRDKIRRVRRRHAWRLEAKLTVREGDVRGSGGGGCGGGKCWEPPLLLLLLA